MRLLDQYGREIGKNRPILDEVGGVAGIRDRYSTYPSQGLTPERLTRIFKQADMGDVLSQADLYEEMEEKDAQLGAVLQTRKLAVAGLSREVVAASDSAEDREIADFVREALDWIRNLDDALVAMLDATGKGYSVSEIIWEVDEGRVWCSDIRWLHPRRFTFNSPHGVTGAPKFLTEAEPAYGEDLLPNKFIYHRAGGRAGSAVRAGVLRPCAWMYLFKNYTLKDWIIFNERFAMPMRIGKYTPGAGEQERKVLREAVFNLGSDAAAVISESTMIELLEGQKSGSFAAYEKLVAYCNAAMSKAVLGHSASADSTAGRLGSENDARDIRRDILEADALGLSTTVRLQLIRPLVAFNFGPDKALPMLRFALDESEDLEKAAVAIGALAGAGLRIPASHVYQRFGIPAPAEGEEVLERLSAPMPFKRGDLPPVLRAGHDIAAHRATLEALQRGGHVPDELRAALLTPPGCTCGCGGTSLAAMKGGQKDGVDELTGRLLAEAPDPAMARVEKLLAESPTLEAFRDGLLDAFKDMDVTELANVMQRAFVAAELAGRYRGTHG
jgi:phage gp29-like protein